MKAMTVFLCFAAFAVSSVGISGTDHPASQPGSGAGAHVAR
jgi:hypothetical protein